MYKYFCVAYSLLFIPDLIFRRKHSPCVNSSLYDLDVCIFSNIKYRNAVYTFVNNNLACIMPQIQLILFMHATDTVSIIHNISHVGAKVN